MQEFIKKRKHLIWWVKDYAALDEAAIVEATLNYGNWDDVQTLIKIMGRRKVARIFKQRARPSHMGRQNFSPKIKHFFKLYFAKHA